MFCSQSQCTGKGVALLSNQRFSNATAAGPDLDNERP